MDARARTSLLRTVDEALGWVHDGARVGVGGSIIADHPMALIRALIRRPVRDLRLVAPTAGLDVDLLISAGCVGRITTAYVGAEGLAPIGPAFRAAVSAGKLPLFELDEGMFVQGLRAAAQQLPFLPWRGGVGTSLPELNPELVEFDDPIRGERLLAVPALELDVALIHADRADAYGNVQIDGTAHMDLLLAAAAERVIVQADELVDVEAIRRRPGATRFWRDSLVVHAPYGTHPYATVALDVDEDALREYVAAASAATAGSDSGFEEYLDRWILGPRSHEEYLDLVGAQRLDGLRRTTGGDGG